MSLGWEGFGHTVRGLECVGRAGGTKEDLAWVESVSYDSTKKSSKQFTVLKLPLDYVMFYTIIIK